MLHIKSLIVKVTGILSFMISLGSSLEIQADCTNISPQDMVDYRNSLANKHSSSTACAGPLNLTLSGASLNLNQITCYDTTDLYSCTVLCQTCNTSRSSGKISGMNTGNCTCS